MTNEYKDTVETVSDIGAMLSASREQLGLSVAAAALKSNLEKEVIEKLEGNRFSELGAPVFTRGYLNIYAKSLGLDEEAVTKRFDTLKEEYELRISPANAASQTKSFKRSYAKSWLLLITIFLVSILLLQQLLSSNSWLMSQITRAFASENATETVTEAAPAQKIALELGENSAEKVSVTDTAKPIPAPEKDSKQTAAPVSGNNIALLPLNAAADSDKETAEKNDNNTQDDGKQESRQETAASANQESAVDTQKTAQVQTDKNEMVLHFTGESWIQVNGGPKGKILLSRTVKSGEDIRFSAADAPFKLNVGRPENVVLTVNGQEQPLNNYRIQGHERRFKVEIPNG